MIATTTPRRGSRLAAGVIALAVVAAGTLVASPAYADTGEATPVVSGGGLHPVAVDFMPYPDRAYVADQGGFINVVNTATDTLVTQIFTAGAPPASNCMLGGGTLSAHSDTYFVSGYNCTFGPRLLNISTTTNEVIQEIGLPGATLTGDVAVSLNGSYALVYGQTAEPAAEVLYVVALQTATVTKITLAEGTPSGERPTSIAFSADSSAAFVTTPDGGVAKVDLADKWVVGTSHPAATSAGASRGIAPNPGGSVLYVANTDGSIGQLDPLSGNSTILITIPGAQLNAIAATPDGKSLIATGLDGDSSTGGSAWLVDIATGTVTRKFRVGGTPWSVDVNLNGSKAYVVANGSGTTHVLGLTNVAPTFSAATATKTATVGKSYKSQFAATGFPAASYKYTGSLPTGLKLSTKTGLLYGTPTKAGKFSFTVVASNGTLPDATTATQTVTVKAGTLTTHIPKISGTKKVGKTLKATTAAWGPAPVTLSYQWYRYTGGTWAKISKATKTSYKLVKADKSHKVRVVVTGKKANYTTATKTSASLSIK